jgi:acetolactate synthase-1/2/3 large subunit
MVRQAVQLAESERPGAVHIELPEDIAAETTTAQPVAPVKVRRPVPDAKAIETAARAIEQAERPIVVVASGANRKLIRKQLRVFLEKTGIPFVTTQMGKGVEDESSPLYIGTTALSAGDYVHHALTRADLVIMLGHDISEKPPIVLTPERCKVIHINFSPADIDAVYEPTHEVVGDVSHALWALSEAVTPNPAWDFSYFKKVHAALEKNIAVNATSSEFPLRPERVVADLSTTLDRDAILALDNGMYKIWIARNYHAHEQNSVLLDNALATMGAGLPSGIATKLLYPDKQVLTVVGDGGLLMSLGDLETAVRLGVHLVVLVLNDSGYGMIKWKQKDMQLPAFGLSFGNPDFVTMAESFGATGHRVDSADSFSEILKTAFAGNGVHLIDCPINYAYTNDALAAVDASAII